MGVNVNVNVNVDGIPYIAEYKCVCRGTMYSQLLETLRKEQVNMSQNYSFIQSYFVVGLFLGVSSEDVL